MGQAQDLVVEYLAAQDRSIRDGESALRGDQSTVHPVRVATRRIRSTLRTFGPLFEPEPKDHLDEELAWIAGLLGEVRDRQVQRKRFTARFDEIGPGVATGPAAGVIEKLLMTQQLRDTESLTEALDSERFGALLETCARWASAPPLACRVRKSDLRKLTAKSRRRTGKKLRNGLSGDDAELHNARKSAKRTRYAAELAAPVLQATKDRRAAKRHENLQTILGEHQDSVVAADLLTRLVNRPGTSRSAAFVFGIAYQRELEQAGTSRNLAERWKA